MALERMIKTVGVALNAEDERRIQHQFEALERRLIHHADPKLELVLTGHPGRRAVEADLRVQVSPLGNHLISKQAAETANQAVRLAVKDVERQLERRHATQRGEPTFGVPSRRRPASPSASVAPAHDQPPEDEPVGQRGS
jgi:hypothetical protein